MKFFFDSFVKTQNKFIPDFLETFTITEQWMFRALGDRRLFATGEPSVSLNITRYTWIFLTIWSMDKLLWNKYRRGMNNKWVKTPTVHMYWVITKLGKRERGKMSFHCSSFYSKNNDHHFAKSDTFMDTLNEYRAFVFKEAVCFATRVAAMQKF